MITTLDQEETDLAEIIKPVLSAITGGGGPFSDVPVLVEYLRVEESGRYRQVHPRNIPSYKLGEYVRFRKTEIEE